MPELLQGLAARLRAAGFAPALAFGALAIAADELEHLPGDLRTMAAQGAHCALMQARLQRIGGEAVLVIVVLLTLVAVARTRTALLARPARSLALLLGAASLGLLAMSAVEAAWSAPRTASSGLLPALAWWPMLEAWAMLVMWGVLWGWLFLQHLQQREADQRLTATLARRAALARQVLEAQLGRARAQLDPATIVRALRAARDRAEGPAGAAPAHAAPASATGAVPLIDHLASYLRLLLQRVREPVPRISSDIELLRALVALQQAQAAGAIELAVDGSVPAHAGRPAGATFLVARLLLDTGLAEGDGCGLRLAMRVDGAAMRIEAAWSGGSPGTHPRTTIAAALQRLAPGLRLEDKHGSTGRRLIAHVPLP